MAVIDCIMTSKTSPINQHSLCSIDDLLKFKDELVLAYLGGFLQFHDSIRVSLINLIFIIQSPS